VRNLTGEREERIKGQQKDWAFSTEEGSRSIVYGAVGGTEMEDKLRGQYISLSEILEPSDLVLGEDGRKLGETLWVSVFGSGCVLLILNHISGGNRGDIVTGRPESEANYRAIPEIVDNGD
jgi:hypothetical protein